MAGDVSLLSVPAWWLWIAVPVLLGLLLWGMYVEARLPDVRVPRAAAVGALQEGGILYPGAHAIVGSPATTTGDWVQQPLGSVTSLATDKPGSAISIKFFGTKIAMTARVGPESGRVYVTIDGGPVPHLPTDSRGSYLDLEATQAMDQSVPIAAGLAHQLHTLTLENGPDGVFALSGFSIVSETPVPWAFTIFYGFGVVLLFLALRGIGIGVARRLGWWLPGPALVTRGPDER